MTYKDSYLRSILQETKTIAMVGVSMKEIRPSYYAFRYLQLKGYHVIPVNPGHAGKTLLGAEIYPDLKSVAAAGFKVDMVDIFRRSEQALPIVVEALEAFGSALRCVWMQIGVVNEGAADLAESHGIKVVMNRCPKIEYQRLYNELRMGGFNTGIISSRLEPV